MPRKSDSSIAALGFRAHSGWAAAVTLAGPPEAPRVVDRRRLELEGGTIEGAKQPFHFAEEMPFAAAARHISRCEKSARELSDRGVLSLLDDAMAHGLRVAGSGILQTSGRVLPDLRGILASHALIHAAEGEHFRDALVRASEAAKIPVTRVKERELLETAASELQIVASQLQSTVTEMGRTVGRPWRQDQKLATLMAWLVLARV